MSSQCLLLESPEQVNNRQFDLLTSHLLLHHVSALESMFALAFELLKPGGRIAMTVRFRVFSADGSATQMVSAQDFEDTGPEV